MILKPKFKISLSNLAQDDQPCTEMSENQNYVQLSTLGGAIT